MENLNKAPKDLTKPEPGESIEAWREKNKATLAGLNVAKSFRETSGHNVILDSGKDQEDLEAINQEVKENM